jgi:hypothetical protein
MFVAALVSFIPIFDDEQAKPLTETFDWAAAVLKPEDTIAGRHHHHRSGIYVTLHCRSHVSSDDDDCCCSRGGSGLFAGITGICC